LKRCRIYMKGFALSTSICDRKTDLP
jgi:hypothetical protein